MFSIKQGCGVRGQKRPPERPWLAITGPKRRLFPPGGHEAMITATSTPWSPWYVAPADHKFASRALIGGVLRHTIEELELRLPEVDYEGRSHSKKRARRSIPTDRGIVPRLRPSTGCGHTPASLTNT